MLQVEIDEENSLAILTPEGALSTEDFDTVRRIIDPLLETESGLKGFIIYTETFPGWESLEGLFSHIRFIMEHHERIDKVALVTDSILGQLAFAGNLLVNARIEVFAYNELDKAKDWVREG